MAAVFYAWEFGANLGHIGTFLPVARELRARGHAVHWAVGEPHQAARLLPREHFTWLAAPTFPEQRREHPPLNYADILLRFGYANAVDLLGLTVAWRELLRLTQTRIVLADHAPTAILAARTLDIPVMLFGNGFFTPPPIAPTPNLRPWNAVPAERLQQTDALALASINAVLAHFDRPALDTVAGLFRVAETSLLTFPELDHYAQRGPARYWGTLPAAVADAPVWPETPGSPGSPGPRVFAYLRTNGVHAEAAMQALRGSGAAVLAYVPDAAPDWLARHAAPNLRFAATPVDLHAAARTADAAVTYASPAATIAFLLAGKPVLMLPGHLEQFLTAQRVVEMGAGLLQHPEQPPSGLAELLARVLRDPVPRDNARAFARKYAQFDQAAVLGHLVRRIEAIVNIVNQPSEDIPSHDRPPDRNPA